MSKVLKKYNKETKKWEVISESLINIDKININDIPIDDNQIDITNPFYQYNDSASTLNDALSSIGSDIETLKRNVSWLAEHGGGGGNGGGGGTSTGYGIYITYPTLENNAIYVNGTELVVKFMITGGTEGEVCQYRYTYDDNYTSQYTGCKINEIVTITIKDINMVNNTTTHTLSINAVNSIGTNIPPVSFKIYESSLNISLNKTRNEISNNEVLMSKNNRNGYVYFDVKNALLGSDTVIKYSCNGVDAQLPRYTNERVNEVIPINVWDVIGYNANVNDLYTVSISAQATLGNITNKTQVLNLNVRITDPNEFTIYFDGLSYLEDVNEGLLESTEIEQSNRLKFSFKVSLPIVITNKLIYYVVAITTEEGEVIQYINGTSFSDDIESVFNQIPGNAGTNIAIQTPLNNLSENKRYIVKVKAWTFDGGQNTVREGSILVLPSNNEIYPRQYNKRYTGLAMHLSADTCLYAWSSSAPMSNNKWVSSQKYVTGKYNDEVTVIGEIIPYNINGSDSGFISSTEIPYLRLQNEAYAIADLSEQNDELIVMVNSQDGFTISITFKCDEFADSSKVVCLFGENTANMDLLSGIKITLETVYWYLSSNGQTYLLKAYIRQNVKNTIDFVYQPTIKKSVDGDGNEIEVPDGFAYIYVNGIVNAVYNIGVIDGNYTFSKNVYFGCDHYDKTNYNFADVNIYEFAIYTKALNPLQIVVNKKNAQLEGSSSNPKVIEDYQEWKHKNLIYNQEFDTNKALSYLIDPLDGSFKYQSYNELRANSPIPIIRINANQSRDFTEAYFHADYSNDKAVTGRTHACLIYYYDPTTKKEVEFNSLIALQGTSTLGYYIKNLEVIVNETCTNDSSKTQLFQPREDWFPEKEFTLKADIVDSSHANNATIGYWINNIAGLMEKNPAMNAMTEEYRPKEKIVYNGKEMSFTHISTIDNKTEIDYDEKVTIKHNLEGFPVIVLIKFSDKNDYDLIGMYSFNLGRYSYYNMGMSFLKSFSRRSVSENPIESSCPSLVDYYEEYPRNERFGGDNGILPNEIFSYEFGASADDNTLEHQTWTQSDISILKYYGDFNFNGEQIGEEVSDTVWKSLSTLFDVTATMTGEQLPEWQLTGKYKYVYQNGEFVKTNNKYSTTTAYMPDFNNYISVNNAVAYFIIAMSFGMIDSLGKNLTLRTWDGGKKWWTCFYDMDTALGLSNEGAENIPEDTFIDKFENETVLNQPTKMKIHYHSKGSGGYNAYYSKLWAILRDTLFLYEYNGSREDKLYEGAWTSLRRTGGPFDSHMNFVNLMTEHIGMCGELLYNYDYNSKYILNSSNLSMLHGLRIEYVRNWLKNRFYFLDGVFENTNISATYLDSPFNSNAFNVTNYGHIQTQIGYIPYTFTSTVPIFIKINTGNADQTAFETQGKYFLPKNTPTTINTPEHTSRKQTNFTSSSVLTQFDGLNGISVITMNTNNSPKYNVLPSLVDFNIAGTTSLDETPIDFQRIFMYKDETTTDQNGKIIGPSCLENINLSSTKVPEGKEYPVDLKSFTKVKNIDISLSNVTSLILPNSTLNTLRVNGSSLREFEMTNQPLLKTLDFTGCNKLTKIKIVNCNSLESLVFDSLKVLQSITIQSCNSINSITIKKCNSLTSILISDTDKLEKVVIDSLKHESLSITIPINALKILNISNIDSKLPLVLTYYNENSFKALEELKIESWYDLPKIIYRNGAIEDEIETYCLYEYTKDGKNHTVKGSALIPEDVKKEDIKILEGDEETDIIFDFSKFTSLVPSRFSLISINNLKYLRLPEISTRYFKLYENTLKELKLLTRVFGSVEIDKYTVAISRNFYLNEPEHYSEINQDLETSEIEYVSPSLNRYFTNIKISGTNLNGRFSNSRVSLKDAIYILKQCSNVENLEATFSSTRVETNYKEPLPTNIFKWCKKAKNIDYIFKNCLITGLIKSEMFSGLTEITSFKGVFSVPSESGYDDIKYGIIYSEPFFNKNNKITIIEDFNPVAVITGEEYNKDSYISSGQTEFFQNKLLENLGELLEINNSFNYCGIDFRRGNGVKLFTNTPKLKHIRASFLNIRGNTGVNKYGLDDNGIPYISDLFGATSIETISSSFNFNSDSDMYIYFGDDFFSKVSDTIKYIGGGYNFTYGETIPNVDGDDAFLSGNVKKYIYKEKCNDNKFPYDILKNCINLTEICSLFKGLYGDNEVIYELPKNMFNNNKLLTNVSYFFKNMNLNYTLTSNSFENNKIINFSGIFQDTGYYGKVGQVPYHFFYQKNGNVIESIKSALAASLATGITHYICTQDVFNAYSATTEENGLITINPYLYDGSVEFYDNYIKGGVIEDIYNLYNTYEIDEETGESKNAYIDDEGNFILDKIPNEIKTSCFNGDNIKYNNLHNVYVEAIKNIDFFRTSKNTIQAEWYGNNSDAYNEAIKFNYFCPPDILNYCKNTNALNINSLFQTPVASATQIVYGPYGYKGRIPEHIFDNISNIISIDAIFSGMQYAMPHINGYGKSIVNENGEVETTYFKGIMYPPNLFNKLTSLTDLTNVFNNHNIWGLCVIDESIFGVTSKNLISISGLFTKLRFHHIDDNIQQLDNNIFKAFGKIRNINSLFASCTNIYFTKDLFSINANPYIEDVGAFCYSSSFLRATTVPEFWLWPATTYKGCYGDISPKPLNDIPSSYI